MTRLDFPVWSLPVSFLLFVLFKVDRRCLFCLRSNQTFCIKIAIRLKVLRPDEVVRDENCDPPVAVAPSQKIIPFQTGGLLDCPDVEEARKMATGNTTVIWTHVRPSRVSLSVSVLSLSCLTRLPVSSSEVHKPVQHPTAAERSQSSDPRHAEYLPGAVLL